MSKGAARSKSQLHLLQDVEIFRMIPHDFALTGDSLYSVGNALISLVFKDGEISQLTQVQGLFPYSPLQSKEPSIDPDVGALVQLGV